MPLIGEIIKQSFIFFLITSILTRASCFAALADSISSLLGPLINFSSWLSDDSYLASAMEYLVLTSSNCFFVVEPFSNSVFIL